MKKALILILFSGLVPFACSPNTNCAGPVKNFRIISFELPTTNLNGQWADTTTYLSHDSVTKCLAIKEKQYVTVNNGRSFSLFSNSAMACDPVESHSVDKITKIDIIARSQVQAVGFTINPGDTATENFSMREGRSGPFGYVQDYVNTEPMFWASSFLLFKFEGVPLSATDLRFDLVLTLSNNDVHSFKNQVLRIK